MGGTYSFWINSVLFSRNTVTLKIGIQIEKSLLFDSIFEVKTKKIVLKALMYRMMGLHANRIFFFAKIALLSKCKFPNEWSFELILNAFVTIPMHSIPEGEDIMVRKRTGRVQFLVLLRLWTGPPQNDNNSNYVGSTHDDCRRLPRHHRPVGVGDEAVGRRGGAEVDGPPEGRGRGGRREEEEDCCDGRLHASRCCFV